MRTKNFNQPYNANIATNSVAAYIGVSGILLLLFSRISFLKTPNIINPIDTYEIIPNSISMNQFIDLSNALDLFEYDIFKYYSSVIVLTFPSAILAIATGFSTIRYHGVRIEKFKYSTLSIYILIGLIPSTISSFLLSEAVMNGEYFTGFYIMVTFLSLFAHLSAIRLLVIPVITKKQII